MRVSRSSPSTRRACGVRSTGPAAGGAGATRFGLILTGRSIGGALCWSQRVPPRHSAARSSVWPFPGGHNVLSGRRAAERCVSAARRSRARCMRLFPRSLTAKRA